MRKILVKTRKEAGLSLEALFNLTVDSYAQWREAGLDEPWMHRTFEEFCEMTRDTAVFVALDAVTNELLAMHCFRADPRRRRAYGYYLAVAPEARREGIASRLLEAESEQIRKAGYTHLHGLTAEKADWSVAWHLHNGYQLIGYKRTPRCSQTTNEGGQPTVRSYATLVFRRQLVRMSFRSWRDIRFVARHPVYALHSLQAFCRLCYWVSYVTTVVIKDCQGRLRLHLKRERL